MPSLSEKDRANLGAILDSANKIKNFVRGIKSADEFYENEMAFDAVLMNFVIIGESVVKILNRRILKLPGNRLRISET